MPKDDRRAQLDARRRAIFETTSLRKAWKIAKAKSLKAFEGDAYGTERDKQLFLSVFDKGLGPELDKFEQEGKKAEPNLRKLEKYESKCQSISEKYIAKLDKLDYVPGQVTTNIRMFMDGLINEIADRRREWQKASR